MTTRLREKGQISLPVRIRESLRLSKDDLLSIARVGDAILIQAKPPTFEGVASKFSERAKEESLTLEDLLKALRKIRQKKG